MNAAVTGGTGFVGRPLVRLLVEQGWAARVLVRQAKDDADIRRLGAEPVRGDLTKPGGCDGFIRTGDVVFHSAARVELKGRWEEFHQTTVEGTRRLLEAALSCRPARFVYVSSAGIYSPSHARGLINADRTPAAPPRFNFYGRAKLEAENLVRSECDRAGCDWTIVRIGSVYGPGKQALVQYFVPLVKAGRVRVIGNGRNRIATVYVDDAAQAVVLAGSHPAAVGKIYDVASDEPVTQQEFFDAATEAFGLPPIRRHVPRRVAYAAATVAEWMARVVRRDPPFSRAAVILWSAEQLLDAGRIRAELGWRPQVGFREGMRRMTEWYRQMQAKGISDYE
jgi:nucleoside-diphosphate-sugar epimerase